MGQPGTRPHRETLNYMPHPPPGVYTGGFFGSGVQGRSPWRGFGGIPQASLPFVACDDEPKSLPLRTLWEGGEDIQRKNTWIVKKQLNFYWTIMKIRATMGHWTMLM